MMEYRLFSTEADGDRSTSVPILQLQECHQESDHSGAAFVTCVRTGLHHVPAMHNGAD